jgi:hypothetical protein
MIDRFLLNGLGMLFLLVLVAVIIHMVRSLINRYRATNYAILKTHITVYELQKMMENRRVCKN